MAGCQRNDNHYTNKSCTHCSQGTAMYGCGSRHQNKDMYPLDSISPSQPSRVAVSLQVISNPGKPGLEGSQGVSGWLGGLGGWGMVITF